LGEFLAVAELRALGATLDALRAVAVAVYGGLERLVERV